MYEGFDFLMVGENICRSLADMGHYQTGIGQGEEDVYISDCVVWTEEAKFEEWVHKDES